MSRFPKKYPGERNSKEYNKARYEQKLKGYKRPTRVVLVKKQDHESIRKLACSMGITMGGMVTLLLERFHG